MFNAVNMKQIIPVTELRHRLPSSKCWCLLIPDAEFSEHEAAGHTVEVKGFRFKMLIMLDAMNKKVLLSKNATTNDNNAYTTLIAGSP